MRMGHMIKLTGGIVTMGIPVARPWFWTFHLM